MNNGEHQREKAEKLSKLAAKLAECPAVTKYDAAGEKEAWTMAHAFIDLEGSFKSFLNDQLPKLLNDDLTPQEIHDLLLDIGDEFRHILYHINDPQFYKQLLEPQPHG
jgi:hypothetical protein